MSSSPRSTWVRAICAMLGSGLGLLIGGLIVEATGSHWIVKCLFAGLGAYAVMRAQRFWLERRVTRP